MKYFMKMLWLTVAALMLMACGKPTASLIEPQYWNDVQVTIEARPYPLRLGMNEFIVLTTAPGRLPVPDVVVDLRVDGQEQWGQGIQDGGTGVFRKALRIDYVGQQLIHVRLKRKGEVKTLSFSLDAVE